MVPDNMKGNTLYPLNTLKNKFPDIYKKQNEKYSGREIVKGRKIPFLNCLWNDVLHFTAVHPSKFKKEQKKAGLPSRKLEWYKVDARLLDHDKTLVYLYKYKKDKSRYMDKDNFTKFNSNKVNNFKKIPKRTSQYYRVEIRKGNRPLLFHFVPHILYKGSLNISKAEKIQV